MSTNTSTGRLMLAVLGGVAELERDLIRTRTSEGRTRAIAQGKKMGRPCQITHTQRQDIIKQRRNGKTLQEIADIFAISSGTVSRIVAGKNGYKGEKSKG